MPDKHVYFSVGATVGCAVVYYIGKNRHRLQEKNAVVKRLNRFTRHWFLYFPVVIFLFGLWGLIPDILHGSGLVEKNITRTDWFNIFFFHSWFEQIEDRNKELDYVFNLMGQVALFSICIGIMCVYISFIKKLDK